MIIAHQQNGTMTPVGGTIAKTINHQGIHYLAKQLFIKPAGSTTSFDFTLTDKNNIVFFSAADNAGAFSENLDLPVYGNWTLSITNAGVDEVFTYLITYLESL